MAKRPAEIHATDLRDDLVTLLNLVGGKPGAETDEADARSRLVGRCISHLQSLVRSMINEHGHEVAPAGVGSTFHGARVTWIADDSALRGPGIHGEPSEPASGRERTGEPVEAPGDQADGLDGGMGLRALVGAPRTKPLLWPGKPIEDLTIGEFVDLFHQIVEYAETSAAEVERLGRLIAEWWSDPDNPPSDVVPIAERWRPDLFGPAETRERR